MTAKRHHHTMKPFIDPDGKVIYQRCTSCAFKCTTAALPIVEARPREHVAVKATDPTANEIWGAKK